ncbi:GYD domain-containing protein [Aliiroseovarius sp. S2029]|uniref:GYD domain-containing protein n=1 Tax=Aliiroseovarius sp. S2029 TaxID=2936988 RepID=UPI0020BD95A3|nr:GYD domain-containing protein [Aliiroseovarius sp. S2029]MCK8482467.1 GYD domain-containing protein [Aliiroseovarius sp. S2029]
MSFYLFKGQYSTDSLRALVDKPEDREAVAGEMISAMGGTLHHLFFCFGEDDVMALIEAPDDEVMAACALVVGASGTMAGGATTKLMTSKEAVSAMEKAKAGQKSYKPVGS